MVIYLSLVIYSETNGKIINTVDLFIVKQKVAMEFNILSSHC
jgi:hypothetical protein